MNKYCKIISAFVFVIGFNSCNDFLDRQPLDQLIPENYFTNADNLAAYTVNFYSIFPTHSNYYYNIGTFSIDNGTDNQANMWDSANESVFIKWIPGQWLVPTSASNWNFTTLRQVNFFLEEVMEPFIAGEIKGSEEVARKAIGEAYFFRAYTLYLNYKEIGDYPIITEVLPDNQDILLEYSVRYPRHLVARQILEDLTQAAKYLPDKSSYGNNGLNKMCAYLLSSRVALFEGTWLKYHKDTALVPGAPGWPGDQSLLNGFNIDNEINYFLTQAMQTAKIVGDQYYTQLVENTDNPVGQNNQYVSQNPYYTMFCDQDLSGYSEVLLYKAFDMAQNIKTQIQERLELNGSGTGWTRGLVNSFLMRNGLPIYAANSGYDPEWENQGITATLQDRDSRIQIFTKEDNCISYYSPASGDPVYFPEGYLLEGTEQTRAVTGFAIKKGKSYDWNQTTSQSSVTGSIIFRAVEALLNYMEACVELTGSIDGTADMYWRAIRKRAYVNPDYNLTIAATNMSQEALGDWGAYSAGNLINPIIYNVRRERRNELIAEALRMDDLRRWSSLDQLMNTPYVIEGMKYWGTVYNDPDSPLHLYSPRDENKEYLAPYVDVEGGLGNISSPEGGPYVRPYQISMVNNPIFNGYRWTRAHYLSPIGQQNFTDASIDGTTNSSVVYQNPGWSKIAGEPATNIN